MKRVLIAYSWSINNIGDIAITPGLIELLREFYPEASLSVMSMYPDKGDEYVNTKGYFNSRYPEVEVMPSPLFDKIFYSEKHNRIIPLIKKGLGQEKFDRFNSGTLPLAEVEEVVDYLLNELPAEIISVFEESDPEIIQTVKMQDFLIYNSGMTLSFGRGEPARSADGKLMRQRDFWNITFTFALPLLLANYLKIPFAIWAQSYEAFDYPSNIFFKRLLKHATFIGARDPQSLEYMKSRQIVNKDMSFRPDSTFFAVGEDNAWADDFLAKHSLKEKEFVTLTIRSSLQGYINKERENTYMSCLCEFIELLTKRLSLSVLLCPEVRSEIQPMYDLIYSRLSPEEQEKCIWMDHFWTTEQARSVYRKAETVISMEMHSIILALGAGTPVLHPRFMEAGRKAWMLHEMNMSEWLFDMDHLCPEELFSAVEKIHQNYAAAQNKVTTQIKQLKLLASESIEKIRQHCL